MAEPMLAETEPECLCGHPKFEHRLGKKGCRNIDCAFGCDRYTPQDVRPATDPVDLDAIVVAAERAADPALPAEEATPAAEPAPEPAANEPQMPAPAATATPAGDWARQAELLATAEQERDHARRLLQDGWDALADPNAANLSAGIVALRQAHGAVQAELTSRGARLDAALKRCGDLEVRAERADALDARLEEIEARGVDLLLHRAEGYELPRVTAAANVVRRTVDSLRGVLDTADVELQIRAEIDELESQLDARRLKLQALAGPADHAPTSRRPLPAPVRVIREWAWAERIPVSANGVPKQEVVDAYIAAHPAALDALEPTTLSRKDNQTHG